MMELTRYQESNQNHNGFRLFSKGANVPKMAKKWLIFMNMSFSAHVATDLHEKSDLEHSILMTDDNWFRRGVKEAIAIRKIQPSLNQDGGRHHLSPMYNKLIRDHVTLKLPRQGADGATSSQN